MKPAIKFLNSEKTDFQSVLRHRVNSYFKENGISPFADTTMKVKTVILLSLFFSLYSLILFEVFNVWVSLGLAIFLGLVQYAIGTGISHDAIHGAYSRKPIVNKFLSYSFHLIGANPYLWKVTHNQLHHTYTNIPDHDEDLDFAVGIVRTTEGDKWKPFMRFQHFYSFPLYGITSLNWVFKKDFQKFFDKTYRKDENKPHPTREYIELFVFKALYYVMFIVVPLLVMDIAWWQFAIGFVAMHMAEGIALGLVFQSAHLVEGVQFPHANENNTIDDSWAAHQLRTTANFARNNVIIGHLTGGLNQQVEHHLFPTMCHTHYPAIGKIVEETAKEYGLPYVNYPTFGSALQSHFRVLKRLSKKPEKVLQAA